MHRSTNDEPSLFLLGAFRLERNQQRIHLPTRKIESLLAYLLLNPGVHTRETLATLFWGDFSDTKARASLRKALALLRKTIAPEVLLTSRETVQINADFSLWVDVTQFEKQALGFLTDLSAQEIPDSLNLYQSDLLSEFHDDWIQSLREHYRALYLDVLHRIVECARGQSEYESAILYAQKILVTDLANERAYQHLMFCYITLGDRRKALEQYEACRRALRDELDVTPTSQTVALYNWIRQSDSEPSSLTSRLTNLPIPLSSFVGRSRELAAIKGLVTKQRLVTLTGAGGSGKTRLAVHAATDLIDSFKDGVWWVDLAPLRNASLVPSAVANTLGLSAQADQSLVGTLVHFLHTKQVLLVLDNCEHLIDACAQLSEHLLTACSSLKLLCTSRESLGLAGEQIWHVPTLSLPGLQSESLTDLLMQYEAIRLFVERASAVKTGFTLTEQNALVAVQICQQLDGIPLAIELAAARVKTMSVGEIAARLNDRFHLLTAENRTSQERHRTLRAAIDWSYDLLTDDERLLFCRLSVFTGGWTLAAAESVCSGEGIEKNAILNLLTRLVDKSLVDHTDAQRYRMLETMRQYGNEKLTQTGAWDRGIRQHLDYYLNMAIIANEKIRGHDQLSWLNWFKAEEGNLATAMESGLGSSADLQKGCELICAVCWNWAVVGDFVIMRHWLETALSRSAHLGRTRARAKTLFSAGYYSVQGLNWLEPSQARSMIEESLGMWRDFGPGFTLECAQCLLGLGWIQKSIFHDDDGYDLINQAIATFREYGNIWWHAWALNLLGSLFVEDSRDPQEIHQFLEEEFAIWKQTGDQCGSALPLFDLGTLALERRDLLEARGYFLKSLKRHRQFGSKGLIFQSINYLADITRGLKQYDESEAYYHEIVPLARALLYDAWLSGIYRGLGFVALHRRKDQQAEQWFHQALMVAREYDSKRDSLLCIACFASLAAFRHGTILALRLFAAFFTQLEAFHSQSRLKKQILEPIDQMEIDESLALCRSQVEQGVFEQVWMDGQSLTFDQVISEILKTVTGSAENS